MQRGLKSDKIFQFNIDKQVGLKRLGPFVYCYCKFILKKIQTQDCRCSGLVVVAISKWNTSYCYKQRPSNALVHSLAIASYKHPLHCSALQCSPILFVLHEHINTYDSLHKTAITPVLRQLFGIFPSIFTTNYFLKILPILLHIAQFQFSILCRQRGMKLTKVVFKLAKSNGLCN